MFRRILAAALLCATSAFAQTSEVIEVTATRIAEDVVIVPASITVIDGEEIRARNANDLATALAWTAGVNATGGSDAGPTSGVPEMWGLREVDAFLLVVDGVPWGGAFNPDLPTLDMTGVDRIEIVRGSAPVMYGATSFVGVIHVIHREAGVPGRDARVSLGSYGSGSVAASLPLTQSTTLRQSIIASAERRGFRDDRSQFDRAHVLYRLGAGAFHFDADASIIRQDPSSPHPRQGGSLSALVPLDANHNPADARLDQNRLHFAGGWNGKNAAATLAITRSDFDIVRGFLAQLADVDGNAAGFRQDRTVTDVYFDAHTVRQFTPRLRAIIGIDHLYGSGSADSELFDYFVKLNGDDAEHAPEGDEETALDDTRNFSGVYASSEWTPNDRLRVDAGARINHTREEREGEDEEGSDRDTRSLTRLSGSIGVNWLAMRTATNSLALFADYRNTFKPAAIDFGPEAEGGILKPETAESVEAGVKGVMLENRLRWQTSVFAMDFSNLVVPTIVDGRPALENAGNERFSGAELELDYALMPELHTEFAYSYHDARFRDYVRDFDGELTQLRGKRFEMSPLHMASAGFVYAPATGVTANVIASYVGERYLNKRNTAVADAYTTWSAGLGWRMARGEFRVDGRNLTNERPPVAESELGDAQYYRLAARSIEASYRMTF